MPVGNGSITELRDFVVLCTDAFGSNNLQLLEIDTHYVDQYNETQKQLNAIRKMNDDEFYAFSKANLLDEMARLTSIIEQRKVEDQRLSDMLAKVESWEVSSEYHNLKKYMIDQLTTSMTYSFVYENCESKIKNLEIEFEQLATQIDDVREKTITALEYDLPYYLEQHNKEVQMVEKSNKWIEGLLSLLP